MGLTGDGNQQPSGLRGDPGGIGGQGDDTRDTAFKLLQQEHVRLTEAIRHLQETWQTDASHYRGLAEGCKRNRAYQSEREYNLLAAESRQKADRLAGLLSKEER